MPTTSIPKRLVSNELINLAATSPKAFVQMCENHYAARIDGAADAILLSGRSIAMITGPSSSGKTTSANKIAAVLRSRGHKASVISLDDFFVGEGHYPRRADGTDDYECLEALDLEQIRTCLKSIAEGKGCKVPQFDFITQKPSGRYTAIKPGHIVLIEGLHAFNPALTAQLPAGSVLRIYAGLREEYCDAEGQRRLCTRDVRLARRLVRDCLFRGHLPDFTLGLWPHVCEAENAYIKVYKNTADYLLDTSFSYEVCLWEKLVSELKVAEGGTEADIRRLEALCREFAKFSPLGTELVPKDSMLREFIGENDA